MVKTRIHEKDVVSVAISPNGKWVATGSCDDFGCLFNLEASCKCFTPHDYISISILDKIPHASIQANESVSDISFSPDSRFVAFVAATDIFVIDLEKPRPPMTVIFDYLNLIVEFIFSSTPMLRNSHYLNGW